MEIPNRAVQAECARTPGVDPACQAVVDAVVGLQGEWTRGAELAAQAFLSSATDVARAMESWQSAFSRAASRHGPRTGDQVGIVARCTGTVLCVGCHTKARHLPSPRERTSLMPLKGHFEAALRLRQRLGWVPVPRGTSVEHLYQSPHAEAVLNADGALLDARGPAVARRRSLNRAALRRRAVREARGRVAPSEARELWEALVCGRWSLIERTDTDGKAFLIAYRNEAASPDPRALTPGEQAALALLLDGLSNRQIGAHLNLSEPAVSLRLHKATRKLGARAPTELMSFARAVLEQRADAYSLGLQGDLQALAASPAKSTTLGLTESEHAVVELVLQGHSRQQIAHKRGVARQTVNNQLASAFARLGVESRHELVDRVLASQS